tara:strand:- start:3821 stop:4135 length:315 start_codon:yes stop_codon:yes gene_type:complete
MASLLSVSIDVSSLPKEKFIKGKNGKVYYTFTMAINDESKYGNNVSVYDAQTPEERAAKKQKDYLGNGKVFWSDGNIVLAEKDVVAQQASAPVAVAVDDSGLPF